MSQSKRNLRKCNCFVRQNVLKVSVSSAEGVSLVTISCSFVLLRVFMPRGQRTNVADGVNGYAIAVAIVGIRTGKCGSAEFMCLL